MPDPDRDHISILEVLHELREFRAEMAPVREDMKTLKDMILAWKTASMFGRALKWIGGIATAMVGFYAAVKGYVVN